MRRRHRRRLERNPQVRVLIDERDREVLRLFTIFRVASVAELRPLVPHHSLPRRLRRLYDAGFLARPPAQEFQRHARRGRAYDLYTLGNQGGSELRRLGLELPATDFDQKAKELQPSSLEHLLATSQTVARLLLGFRSAPRLELEAVLPDGRFRARVRIFDGRREQERSLTPDAVLRVREQPTGARTALLVEVDCDTLHLERRDLEQSSFRRHVLSYLAYWQDPHRLREELNADDFTVLTIAPTPQRVAALRGVVERADPEGRSTSLFWFTTAAELASHDPLTAPIWTTAAGETGSLFGQAETHEDHD